ncbi:MAG TPA: XRE family transcriptional regulator [Gemmatimonadaceae bacterium]|jgi:DNA-binding transcriptional regulator YiaG
MTRKLKTTPWKEIKNKKLSPDARARVQERVATALAELPLHELRRARALSQVTLAELLNTTQPEVSKIEHRTDLYVSTLRRYVEAMGGELDIVARFPDGSVRINQFEGIGTA